MQNPGLTNFVLIDGNKEAKPGWELKMRNFV